MKSIAARMMALFSGFEGAHGTHGEPYQEPGSQKWLIKSTARTLREPVSERLWESHLNGQRPLGVIPIRSNNTCCWGSDDIDKYDVNLFEIIERVEAHKLPLVPCRSKSGGLHLFLFLTEPQPANTLQAALAAAAAAIGHAGCEIFPKQTTILHERGDVGNWMVMPYFGGDFGGRLAQQVGLKKTGSEMTVEEFLAVAEGARITPEQLAQLTSRQIARANAKTSSSDTVDRGYSVKHGVPFGDGPPCLQQMAQDGVQPGTQNNVLLMMGIYYKRAAPDNWQEKLENANHEFLNPPGSSEGLQTVVRSLRKKDYQYTCKIEPMVSHCNSRLCRVRQFGVGEGRSRFPVLSAISRLLTDPPIWFVDVEDCGRVEVSTETLTDYKKFTNAILNSAGLSTKIDRHFAPLSALMWSDILDAALANAVHVEAPPDISVEAIFREHLEDFLTNRSRGKTREDMFRGVPWEDAETGRHYFRLRDLARHMDREKVRDFTRGQMAQLIKKLGGGPHFFSLKVAERPVPGAHNVVTLAPLKVRGLSVHWVPKEAVERAPEVPAPRMEADPI